MEISQLNIGMQVPDFAALSTMGPIRMSDYKGKWVIFFSHPGDFTPVCTTEFIAFAQTNQDFVDRNAQLLGISIDSNPSHLAWVYDIYLTTGITIPFPIVSDRSGDIARSYGMFAPDVTTQETIRDVFIIDPLQTVRAILIYPATNGRNINEILRLLIAIQTTDEYGVLTPANWEPGQPVMVPPPLTYEGLIRRETDPERIGLECEDWWWCYRTIPFPESE
ncbi:peroxiredoxin [Sinanaerobacter sp. ZZT-01]|uniref:peroxiredoxin n=1 Tax=Sinanaerobacter sp. ZZT-01 TaxID=3111540 RepID=UPI002D78B94A|nr:peroxiredoxin [Sinanaerobacter sp. ZZT-01]WRR94098.1 peroxiredoxin [Sinanaerobacter sp. ZZT-01]